MAGKSGTFSDTGSQVNVTVTGGNVTASGSPTAHETAVFTGATGITGVATGTAGQVLTSNGASADPSYQDAAGGSPGSPDLSIQGNSGGSFVGIPGTSFDASKGTISLTPVSQGITPSLIVNSTATANAANFLSAGAEQAGTIHVFSNDLTGVGSQAISGDAWTTDDAGSGIINAIVLNANAVLQGTNVAGDSAFTLFVSSENLATGSGAPTEVTTILIGTPAQSATAVPVTSTGMHINDQNGGGGLPGSTVNAALLIDDQTPGANVYAIKTGLGPVLLGDVLTITPVAFSGLPASPVAGMIIPITDANTTTFGATISAGSGGGKGLAYYDGTNWTFR